MRAGVILAFLLAGGLALAAANKVVIEVEGMSCGGCADKVKEALAKLPEVEASSVKVVLKEKTATLSTKGDAVDSKTLAAIKNAIESTGEFTVTVKSH